MAEKKLAVYYFPFVCPVRVLIDIYLWCLTVTGYIGREDGVYDYDLYGLLPDGHYCCQVTAILSLSQSVVSPSPE